MSLLTGYYLSTLPWTPNEPTLSPPPPNTPLFFSDAAFSVLTAASAFLLNNKPHYSSWILPKSASSNQQSAELFALYKTTQLALSLHSSPCVISDSTSSLQALLSFKSGAHSPNRAKILRQFALLISSLTKPLYLLWTKSETNPADLPSRYLPISPIPCPFSPLSPLSLQFCLSTLPSN
jgi:hypothetical protein